MDSGRPKVPDHEARVRFDEAFALTFDDDYHEVSRARGTVCDVSWTADGQLSCVIQWDHLEVPAFAVPASILEVMPDRFVHVDGATASLMMRRYHSMWDPIYAVCSAAFAGQSVDRSLVEAVKMHIDELLERGRYDPSEEGDVVAIVRGLEQALGRK